MSIEVEVQNATDAENIPGMEQIQCWVEAALEGRKETAELVVRIVDVEESAQLNQQYRGKQGATNVLSFLFKVPEMATELSSDSGLSAGSRLSSEMSLLGDVVICAPVVEAQAREQGKELFAHWAHMVVHGCLHLIGLDHQVPKEADKMENMETKILKKLGYPAPYENG